VYKLKEAKNRLLVFDGIVNLILGILLLLFPFGIAPVLGLPIPNTYFYPTILGAVLFGIGIALLMDSYTDRLGIRGLGIAGAIVINFCGAIILILWLIFASLDLPLRGYIILWIIAVLVLAIGFIELISKTWAEK
jgi:hypothetical protein